MTAYSHLHFPLTALMSETSCATSFSYSEDRTAPLLMRHFLTVSYDQSSETSFPGVVVHRLSRRETRALDPGVCLWESISWGSWVDVEPCRCQRQGCAQLGRQLTSIFGLCFQTNEGLIEICEYKQHLDNLD